MPYPSYLEESCSQGKVNGRCTIINGIRGPFYDENVASNCMFTCYGCDYTPLPILNTGCGEGYGDYGRRFNQGLGRITIVITHEECSARCTQFSGPEFSGGCKSYMTGMYFGMLFCRSYGRNLRTTPCPWWAVPLSPGISSGSLGFIHPQTGQQNLGGNCCSNITAVEANVAADGFG